MLWLQIEDSYYYSNLKEAYAYAKKHNSDFDIENVVTILSKEQFNKMLDEADFSKTIISPYLPKHFGQDTPFFGILKVPNKYGLLTTSEKKAGITEYQKLHAETGLTIEESPFTFEDMAGSKKLKEIANKLLIKYLMGEIPKGVFLAGVPGTGKTFFAQCLAGETKRFLVSLNLTKLMYEENPIEAFDKIINYLQKENKKYLFWVDEIEKMFTGSEKSEHMKNKFLTFLNDIGLTINIDAFVVMTANNVTDILKKNPELIRGGRVETFAKVFMDFPTEETAATIFQLYIEKRNKLTQRIDRLASYIQSRKMNTEESKVLDNMWINSFVLKVMDVINQDAKSFSEIKESIEENIENEEVQETLENMKMPLKAEDITYYIDRNYTVVCNPSVAPEDFPYVPAEIKEMTTQLYYIHLEKNLNNNPEINDIYNDLMRDNIPIGEAGSMGIDIMKGNQEKFSVIIK